MEPPVYFKTQYIDAAHCDAFGRLRPSALLEVMQEAAGEHAELLGFGRAPMLERELFWAIVRQSLEIERLPRIGETLVVETWPGKPTRTAFPRHMIGRTDKGEVLFRSVTLWLFMNMRTRAMVLPGAAEINFPGADREGQLKAPGGIIPKEGGSCETRTVRYSELDCNGHMSNTKYLNWMEDVLPPDFHRDHSPKKLQINYLSEALCGQQIELNWQMEDNLLTLTGKRPDARVFAIKTQY